MFKGIESKTFDDPEFKEDSVRELILTPIITKLGYHPSGSVRVTRSKTLQNPFIRVGTRNHLVTTIPDYTFYVDNKPVFVLDAKGPKENILKHDHIQQAYSYSIHPEIRCEEFGLCNGREIAIFNTSQIEPLLQIKFEDFESRWNEIEKFLSPKYLAKPILRKFTPDFGLALKRMGLNQNSEIHLPGIRLNLFAKINETLMTASANIDIGFGDHCASFDFHPKLLPLIVSGLPDALRKPFVDALGRSPFRASARLVIELDLKVTLGEIIQVQLEVFVPLIINEIQASRFNPSEIENDPNNIPSYIFKLRDNFKIKPENKND